MVPLYSGTRWVTGVVKVNDDYSYFVKIMKIENTVDDGSDDLRKF